MFYILKILTLKILQKSTNSTVKYIINQSEKISTKTQSSQKSEFLPTIFRLLNNSVSTAEVNTDLNEM